ncbi:hypothetical protein AURDEDRAFT_131481, partial [Auricularia subglabra TFB-10046 SS5]
MHFPYLILDVKTIIHHPENFDTTTLVYPPMAPRAQEVARRLQVDAGEPEDPTWVLGNPSLNARINRLHKYSNSLLRTFSFTQLPAIVRFLALGSPRRHSRILVLALSSEMSVTPGLIVSGDRLPATLWAVGTVSAFDRQAHNRNALSSITIRVLDSRVMCIACALQERFSQGATGATCRPTMLTATDASSDII